VKMVPLSETEKAFSSFPLVMEYLMSPFKPVSSINFSYSSCSHGLFNAIN
jgi:hypothetical protein